VTPGKLRIFISSVQKEFSVERKFLKDFICDNPLLKKFFDVFIFENMPASSRNPNEAYLKEVEQCDIFIALFGDEYGRPNKDGLSPTQQEYIRAAKLHKTRLVYVKGRNDSRRDPKMLALINSTEKQVVRRRFDDPNELAAMVYASLVDCLEQLSLLRTGPFDASFCRSATLNDISPDKVRWFLGRAKRARKYALAEDTSVSDALTQLNLLDHKKPSNAAVLLFGKAPQRFLISSEVKCLHFHGTEFSKPIPSYQIYKGTLFDLVDEAVDFVLSKLNRYVGTRANGPAVPVRYDIPEDVVAEGIVNAIAHRDYTSNASVQVMLFSDRLEIWNPGTLPHPLTVTNLLKVHQSIPANPLIAEPLFLAKYIEKVGSGTIDMAKLCAKAGLPPPEFRQESGAFILTIWRDKRIVARQVSEQVVPSLSQVCPKSVPSEIAESVLHKSMGGVDISELMRSFGQTNRTRFRIQTIRPLMNAGLLALTIPDKPQSSKQKYKTTEKGKQLLMKK
jgi:ATP-dependent DNA helicase RecG